MEKIICSILENKTFEEVLPNNVDPSLAIIEAENLIQERISKIKKEQTPVFINIFGLPASGKTTIAKEILKTNQNLLYISFDEIMESLSFYRADYLKDKEWAFKRWELPARVIGYKLLNKSLKERLSILFEHSNAIPQHIGLYKKIISLGYSVEMQYINAMPDLVVNRLEKRGRFFDEKRVYERWDTLQKLIPEYKKMLADKFITLEPWKE